MLSIENPPRDPPCPSHVSQLKTSSNTSGGTDDKASDKLHIVDLYKSDHPDPPPKFSIRDYVFNTRSKDIENNWPFSQEKLQLCRKHGVTDLLPPFQSSDTVRKPSLRSCPSDSVLSEKGNTQNDYCEFVEPDSAGCDPNVAGDCLDTILTGCEEEEREFPSALTSHSCSEIDSVVPANKSPEFETDILPDSSVARAEVGVPGAANRTQTQVKKCRLVVKLGNVGNLNTKEDTSGNNFMVSEAMASKVCPVCKTFSSSSNTTLNAHIDQCLSVESTTKSSSNSRVIKHRIKPRKIKSMVEIYTTAPHCTLEELDRRNGTNWATNSIFPAEDVEADGGVAQKKQGSSPANLEETPDEGAVYIDANGTKLRILSKSNDPSLDSPRPKKLVNRDKVSSFLLPKKKKQNQMHKRHKLMKHGKRISTSRPHRTSENKDNQGRNFSAEGPSRTTQHFKSQDQVKFSQPDMICGWVSSKRTGLTKKMNGRDDNQLSGNCDSRDLSVENNKLSLGDSQVKSSCGSRTSNACQNSSSSPGSSKQTDKSLYELHDDDETRELSSVRKRLRMASVESQVSLDKKRSQPVPGLPDHNNKQSRKDKPPNQEEYVPLVSKRKVQRYAGEDRNVDHPVIDPKNSSGHNTHSAEGRMPLRLRNKPSSGRASTPTSKLNFKRKNLAFKKSRVHCLSESNGGPVSPVNQEYLKQHHSYDRDRVGKTCDLVSIDRNGVLKTGKSGGENMIPRKEEHRALMTSQSLSSTYPCDAEDNDGSFMLGSASGSRSDDVESAGKNIHPCEEDFNMEPPSEVAMGPAFTDLRNSLETQFHQLASSSDAHCESEQFSDVYKETQHFEDEAPSSSAEPILSGRQEMFCAAEVPENMDVVTELGSSDMHGNYFVEVDPIPIPGPPGSFLPSPGHSEDLPGNSSLTSSRIQSSEDHQELVDQASDSPVSATSSISNSTLARPDSKSPGMLVGRPPVLDGFIVAANGNSIVENPSLVLVDAIAGAEMANLDKLKINTTSTEKVVFRYKDQPCCCSRKEGFSQSVPLNCQELPLLRRRNMPASGKEMSCDVDRRLDTIRSEMSSVTGHGTGDEIGTKSPIGHTQQIAADSHIKFPSRDSCEPSSPPTPNPVLRLMGKNLMVVNNDESLSSQIKPSQLNSIVGHVNPHVLPVSGVSVVNGQNENLRIACHLGSQDPYSLQQAERTNMTMQQSEWSDGYSSHENTRTSQMLAPPLVSPAMLSGRGGVGSLVGPLMHHEYIPGYNLLTEQCQQLNRMGRSTNSDVEEFVRSPSLRWRNANTTSNRVKEIIVIDDAPENELDSTPAATQNQGMQGMESSSAGKSTSMTLACGSRHASNLYGYPQHDSATYCGSPGDASFWMPSHNVVNGSPSKWNWAPEGSSSLHSSPLTASSFSAAQLRPKFYTYPNLK